MKHLIFSLTFLLITGAGAIPAQAQTESTEPQELQSRTEELSARIKAKVNERVSRYEEFQEKIVNKRNQLQEEGANISELDRLIRVAENEMTQVKADVTQLENNLDSLDYDQPTREIVRTVVTSVNDVRASFRTLHKTMKDVVSEIKKLSNN